MTKTDRYEPPYWVIEEVMPGAWIVGLEQAETEETKWIKFIVFSTWLEAQQYIEKLDHVVSHHEGEKDAD